MLNRLLPALFLAVYASGACSQTEPATPAVAPVAESTPAAEPAAEPAAQEEKIIVAGQRPGPGLWKVSKDDHVLWIFGTFSPLPKKMQWRSQQVEAILAQTQEFIKPPNASPKIGFFRGLTLLPSMLGFENNPNGATLREVLPADVYGRWLPLKEKYLPDNQDVERQRPIFASQTLFRAGLDKAGLAENGGIGNKIDSIVKQRKIKVTSTSIEVELDSPSKAIKDFKNSPVADVECFSRTLARLETDIDAMRVRAGAWAKGDLEGIRKLKYPDQVSECGDALLNSAAVKDLPGFKNIKQRLRANWVGAAEKALASNVSTFAIMRLSELLDPHGVLAELTLKGYKVDTPD